MRATLSWAAALAGGLAAAAAAAAHLSTATADRQGPAEPATAAAVADEVFTDEQLYWVAVGQTWCAKRTDANLRRQVALGPHSPEPFRVLGPASQSAAFAKAFDCPVGSRYRPTQTCTVYGA